MADWIAALSGLVFVTLLPGLGLVLLLGRRVRVLRGVMLVACGSLAWNLVVGTILSVAALPVSRAILAPALSAPLVLAVLVRNRGLYQGMKSWTRSPHYWCKDTVFPLLVVALSTVVYAHATEGMSFPSGGFDRDSFPYMAMTRRYLSHCRPFGVHPYTLATSFNPPGFAFVMGAWHRVSGVPLGRLFAVWGSFWFHGVLVALAFYQVGTRVRGPWTGLFCVSVGLLYQPDVAWIAFQSRSLTLSLLPALTFFVGFLDSKRGPYQVLLDLVCLSTACFYHFLCVLLLPLGAYHMARTLWQTEFWNNARVRRSIVPPAVLGFALGVAPIIPTLATMGRAESLPPRFRDAVHARSWSDFTNKTKGPVVLLYPFIPRTEHRGLFRNTKGVGKLPGWLRPGSRIFRGFSKNRNGRNYPAYLLVLTILIRARRRQLGRFDAAVGLFYLLPFLGLVSQHFLAARAVVWLGFAASVGAAYMVESALYLGREGWRGIPAACMLYPLWAHGAVVGMKVNVEGLKANRHYRKYKAIPEYLQENVRCQDTVVGPAKLSKIVSAESGALAPYVYPNNLLGRKTRRSAEFKKLFAAGTSMAELTRIIQKAGLTYLVGADWLAPKYSNHESPLEPVFNHQGLTVFRVRRK